VLFVPPDSPFQTVQDVIAAAKRNPGSVSFATPRDGTSSHLAAALLSSMSGITLQHVPYRPEFKELCHAQGLDVAIIGPADMRTAMPKEFAKWKKLADLAGAKEQR